MPYISQNLNETDFLSDLSDSLHHMIVRVLIAQTYSSLVDTVNIMH